MSRLIVLAIIMFWQPNLVLGDEPGEPDEQVTPLSEMLSTEYEVVDEAQADAWGIHNNCINLNQVSSFNFRDDQQAILTMRAGKKKILMTLTRKCAGVKNDGFITNTRTTQLCARFDHIQSMWSKQICQIKSFHPVIELEAQQDEMPELEVPEVPVEEE